VWLHWLFAAIAKRNKALGILIKGAEIPLVENGKICSKGLDQAQLTEADLMEALRSNGGTCELKNIKAAYLERSGKISVLRQ